MRLLLVSAILLLVSGQVSASLIDRGNGLIYDTNLDITWMQDVNYASTVGWPSSNNGKMSHQSALSFVDQIVFEGFDNWRLPTTPILDSSCNENFISSFDHGFNCSGSELGHLFYQELSNLGADDVNGNPQVGFGFVNTGPFINFPDGVDSYWASNLFPGETDIAFIFDIHNGITDRSHTFNIHRVWAVHDGDIGVSSVPAPATLLLFLTGLIGLIGFNKRRNAT